MLGRRQAALDDLERRAGDPRGWLAVERQARSLLRQLGNDRAARRAENAPVIEAHRAHLDGALRRSAAAVADLDAGTLDGLRRSLGVRVAVMGKGGAGKTVISSTLTRLLGRWGHPVLAADLDVNPGLAISLGLEPTEAGLPLEAVEERQGAPYGWALAEGLLPREVVQRHTIAGPDGVRFLGLGKLGSPDKTEARRSVTGVLQVLLGFGEPDWHVVADMEAGPTTPFERYHAFADDVLVVVGPAWRSGMTARRLLPMVDEDRRLTIVASRYRAEPDHPGLAPAVRIPFDPDVAEAERQGLSPLDACPDSPAIEAIRRLADLLTNQEVRA